MAELVDALASEASKLRFVEVQVLLSPPLELFLWCLVLLLILSAIILAPPKKAITPASLKSVIKLGLINSLDFEVIVFI